MGDIKKRRTMQDPTLQTLQQTVLRQVQVPARIHQEVAGQYDMPILQRDENETAQLSCRLGDASCASAHSEMLNRDSKTDVGTDVEHAIQSARGGGQVIDSTVRAQMEPAFGADFGGVRVHTDGQADGLNRDLNARAFTTGQDIFFRRGEYNPGSSGGRELLTHELTHVVQQNGDQVQTKLTLGAPGDIYEQEADSLARDVLQQGQRAAQRQVQPEDEEVKMMQAKSHDGLVQRQVEEENTEEEPLQTKYAGQVRRQGEDESKKQAM
jgi:hypothetical protein